MTQDNKNLLNLIAQTIFDKKGFNILALHLGKEHSLCDYLVIAEAHVDRHAKALADAVQEMMKQAQKKLFQIEGGQGSDWVVLSYENVMIHIFLPSSRNKYQLERLWQKASIIDLDIKTQLSAI
jgi:ribosome-associated protein